LTRLFTPWKKSSALPRRETLGASRKASHLVNNHCGYPVDNIMAVVCKRSIRLSKSIRSRSAHAPEWSPTAVVRHGTDNECTRMERA
jgi:hypothetical protein